MVGTGRLFRVEGNLNGAKYSDILEENLVQSAQGLRLGQRFNIQQDNDAKHTANLMQELLRKRPSHSPDLTS